jgi:hypothetical protein
MHTIHVLILWLTFSLCNSERLCVWRWQTLMERSAPYYGDLAITLMVSGRN